MRIALIRPDRIGDCVIGSCAINDIRKVLPDANIFWIVRQPMRELFAGTELPATLITYDPADEVSSLTTVLKNIAPDIIITMTPDLFVDQAIFASSTPIRIGFYTKVTGALTVTPRCNKKKGQKHEVEYVRDLLRLIPGFEKNDFDMAKPALYPEKTNNQWRSKLGIEANEKGFFVIHPAAHGKKARLPLSIWLEVAEILFSKTGFIPVFVGDMGDPISSKISCVDLRAKLSLTETMHILKEAKLCFSRDSGPAHISAALNCPTVCIFLENSAKMGPIRWTPINTGSLQTIIVRKPTLFDRLFYKRYKYDAGHQIQANEILRAAFNLLKITETPT